MPTYPKETLPEAVKTVCKSEYNMDVEVTVTGSTMGIYYPMEGLLDVGMGISENAWDKISNLLLIASRVVLSTDADVNFYCVVTQDPRLPELQVVIIKYVDDVKLGMYQNISRNESFKRTLFSINLTPQAKKERSIEQIFDRMDVEEGTREKVLEEFFRSPPTRLSDIGYWRGGFYLKDITKEEFLAEQISNRIKLDFNREKELQPFFKFHVAESAFKKDLGIRAFLLSFNIEEQPAEGSAKELRLKKIEKILQIANEVFYGYKFSDFDSLIMIDQLENARLVVNGRDVYDFSQKRLSVRDIVQAPSEYF